MYTILLLLVAEECHVCKCPVKCLDVPRSYQALYTVYTIEKVIIIANHLRDKVPDRLHCVVSQL